MKKYVFILIFFLPLLSMGQKPVGIEIEVQSITDNFLKTMPAGSYVIVLDSMKKYRLDAKFTASQDMGDVFSSGNYRVLNSGSTEVIGGLDTIVDSKINSLLYTQTITESGGTSLFNQDDGISANITIDQNTVVTASNIIANKSGSFYVHQTGSGSNTFTVQQSGLTTIWKDGSSNVMSNDNTKFNHIIYNSTGTYLQLTNAGTYQKP